MTISTNQNLTERAGFQCAEHSFNTKFAEKYGIEEAILFKYIGYVVSLKDEKFLEDGKYWFYTTTKKLKEYFTYMTEKQIVYALNNLRKCNLIISKRNGYTNQTGYTLVGVDEPIDKIVNRSRERLPKLSNSIDKIVNRNNNIYNINSNLEELYIGVEDARVRTREATASPTLEEIQEFCKQRKSIISPERFYDHYSVSGWKDKDGKSIVSCWKQRVLSWEKYEVLQQPQENNKNFIQREYKKEELNGLFQSVEDIDV